MTVTMGVKFGHLRPQIVRLLENELKLPDNSVTARKRIAAHGQLITGNSGQSFCNEKNQCQDLQRCKLNVSTNIFRLVDRGTTKIS